MWGTRADVVLFKKTKQKSKQSDVNKIVSKKVLKNLKQIEMN